MSVDPSEKVTIVQVNVPGPTLQAEAGQLVPTDDRNFVVTKLAVAVWHLGVVGSSLPRELQVGADLFTRKDGSGEFFVTVSFVDAGTAEWALWRTFKVEFPGGTYDDATHDHELVALLRAAVGRGDK